MNIDMIISKWMNVNLMLICLGVFVFVVLIGCVEAPIKTVAVEAKGVSLPVFNGDSAYMFVEKQVVFGPRVPNSLGHENCGRYLESVLRMCSDDVVVQNFNARVYTGDVLSGKNYVASFAPDKTKRILLMAHWDSRHIADRDSVVANRVKPVLGANDGASGVGVLLEMAMLMKDNPPPVGVDIVLFDLEDYGPTESDEGSDLEWCLGSQYWSNNPHKLGYKAQYGILLDMVGDINSTFYVEGFSKYYAESIVKKVWGIARDMGYDNYFKKEDGGYITDDHLFVNRIAGIPSINIVNTKRDNEGSFAKYWHTTHDDMENIDKSVLQAVGDVLVRVVYE